MIPCGIPDRGATSLARKIDQRVDMQEVSDLVVKHFVEVFGVAVEKDLDLETLRRAIRTEQPLSTELDIVTGLN